MSLDQNLFTLVVKPHEENPEVLDLVDPNGVLHYRKQRVVEAIGYKIEVYDPLSESLLSTVTAPSVSSKHRTIELYNPTVVIELKYTGRLAFKWSFKWEEHEFEWKREECYMLRKPDPPVLVAVTKEPQGKIKTTSVQILDYNLRRFEIDDRRGLEIVILTALLSFSDTDDTNRKPSSSLGPSRQPSELPETIALSDQAPVLPPKPPAKRGIDRIVEKQAMVGEINEVTVDDEGTVEEYGKHCAGLLEEDAMLFITVRSADAQFVSKVLQVIEETKRIRHKSGLDQDEDLHQYVVHESTAAAPSASSAQKGKGPRIINLDDDPKDKAKNKATDKSKAQVNDYKPPTSLAVHLSKIPMPELHPKKTPGRPSSPPKKKEKATKTSKNTREDDHLAASSSNPSKPKSPARVKPHEVHPHQPSPSPAQLNNPLIYAAPPPLPRSPRPPQNQAMPIPAHSRESNNNSHAGNWNPRQPPTNEGPTSSPYGGPSAAYTIGMPMLSPPPPLPPSSGAQRPSGGNRVSSFFDRFHGR